MTLQFRQLPENADPDAVWAEAAIVDGAITDAAILVLRRRFWLNGTIDNVAVRAIFALDDQISRPSKAWIAFFVEAVSEFLISASTPRGTLSEIQTDWLLARVDRDGQLDSPARLELLVHLLEKLDCVPARMKAYVLDQVERAVMSGVGATRDRAAGQPAACCITTEECVLLRRLIFAPAGFAPAQVSVEEADMLFRIKDATLAGDNAPAWKTLFVQGVANYLSAWQRKSMRSAEQEEAHQRFLRGRNPGLDGYIGFAVRQPPGGLLSAGPGGRFGRRQPDNQREQTWIDTALPADGKADPLETALIAFMREDIKAED